jgi:hypothetical protein
MQERFNTEQALLAKERAREKEARKAAYRKEQERIAKAEASRAETEKILDKKQKEVEDKKREMLRRDEERAAMKAEKQRILVRMLLLQARVADCSWQPLLVTGKAACKEGRPTAVALVVAFLQRSSSLRRQTAFLLRSVMRGADDAYSSDVSRVYVTPEPGRIL